MIDQETYFAKYKEVVSSYLNRPECIVQLAVLIDDPDVCLGFSVIEQKTLHFAFVKYELRDKGIGKSLMPEGLETFSHITRQGRSIWKKKFKQLIFNPFL